MSASSRTREALRFMETPMRNLTWLVVVLLAFAFTASPLMAEASEGRAQGSHAKLDVAENSG